MSAKFWSVPATHKYGMIGPRQLKSFFEFAEVPRDYLIFTRSRTGALSVRVDWESLFYDILTEHETIMAKVSSQFEQEGRVGFRRQSPRSWPSDLV